MQKITILETAEDVLEAFKASPPNVIRDIPRVPAEAFLTVDPIDLSKLRLCGAPGFRIEAEGGIAVDDLLVLVCSKVGIDFRLQT